MDLVMGEPTATFLQWVPKKGPPTNISNHHQAQVIGSHPPVVTAIIELCFQRRISALYVPFEFPPLTLVQHDILTSSQQGIDVRSHLFPRNQLQELSAKHPSAKRACQRHPLSED